MPKGPSPRMRRLEVGVRRACSRASMQTQTGSARAAVAKSAAGGTLRSAVVADDEVFGEGSLHVEAEVAHVGTQVRHAGVAVVAVKAGVDGVGRHAVADLKSLTAEPIWATVPLPSWPKITGRGVWKGLDLRSLRSLVQMTAAPVLRRS